MSSDRGGRHAVGQSLPIQQPRNFSFRTARTTKAQWWGVPSCWKMISGCRSSICGKKKSFQHVHVNCWGHCILGKEKRANQAVMEKATPHIDLCTVTYVFIDHVGVFRAAYPHIVLVDLPRYMKANFLWEHDLIEVIFVILNVTEHFQDKCLMFASVEEIFNSSCTFESFIKHKT